MYICVYIFTRCVPPKSLDLPYASNVAVLKRSVNERRCVDMESLRSPGSRRASNAFSSSKKRWETCFSPPSRSRLAPASALFFGTPVDRCSAFKSGCFTCIIKSFGSRSMEIVHPGFYKYVSVGYDRFVGTHVSALTWARPDPISIAVRRSLAFYVQVSCSTKR